MRSKSCSRSRRRIRTLLARDRTISTRRRDREQDESRSRPRGDDDDGFGDGRVVRFASCPRRHRRETERATRTFTECFVRRVVARFDPGSLLERRPPVRVGRRGRERRKRPPGRRKTARIALARIDRRRRRRRRRLGAARRGRRFRGLQRVDGRFRLRRRRAGVRRRRAEGAPSGESRGGRTRRSRQLRRGGVGGKGGLGTPGGGDGGGLRKRVMAPSKNVLPSHPSKGKQPPVPLFDLCKNHFLYSFTFDPPESPARPPGTLLPRLSRDPAWET
jgi:hypothetical protein